MRQPKGCYPCLGFARERFKKDLIEIPCPHFKLPTPEQVEAEEVEFRAFSDRLQKVIALVQPIRKEFKGKSYSGTLVCPNCGTNLFVRMAPNGHMRGNCETPDCVHWIE